MQEQIRRIGFIGVGTMGQPMAKNLINAGFELFLYDLYPEKAKELVPFGAKLMESPAAVAQNALVVITMVNDAPNLREALEGENSCLKGASAGCIFIDTSTIAPNAVRAVNTMLKEHGHTLLDAPVSGGKKGAEDGTLTIMVGGDEAAYQKCLPVLQAMGKTITYLGGSGSGQVAKMGNQIMLGLNTLGICEGLMLASREGLDLEQYLCAVSAGAAKSGMLDSSGKAISERNFAGGFPVKLIQKDFRLIGQTLTEQNLALPGAAVVQQLYNAVAATDPALGLQGIMVALEKLNSFQVGKYDESERA